MKDKEKKENKVVKRKRGKKWNRNGGRRIEKNRKKH